MGPAAFSLVVSVVSRPMRMVESLLESHIGCDSLELSILTRLDDQSTFKVQL